MLLELSGAKAIPIYKCKYHSPKLAPCCAVGTEPDRIWRKDKGWIFNLSLVLQKKDGFSPTHLKNLEFAPNEYILT